VAILALTTQVDAGQRATVPPSPTSTSPRCAGGSAAKQPLAHLLPERAQLARARRIVAQEAPAWSARPPAAGWPSARRGRRARG